MLFLTTIFLLITASQISMILADTAIPKHKDISDEATTYVEEYVTPMTRRCGGSIRATSGRILYKTFEPYDSNERCVWVIRAPLANTYTVTIESLGSPGSLVVTGLGLRGRISETTSSGVGSVSVPNSNVVLITFFTGPENNVNRTPGFSLTYKSSVGTSIRNATYVSVDQWLESFGQIKHPASAAEYANDELSNFILGPQDSIHRIGMQLQLLYTKQSLEGQACYDELYVYQFSPATTTKWVPKGKICGETTSITIQHDDLILVSFQSDGSNTYTGFNLIHTGCN